MWNLLIDQQVDAAMLRAHLGKEAHDGLLIPQIERVKVDLGMVESVRGQIGGDHPITRLGQPNAELAANPASGAGDQCDLFTVHCAAPLRARSTLIRADTSC